MSRLFDEVIASSMQRAHREGALVGLRAALAIIQQAPSREAAAQDIRGLVRLLESTSLTEGT